MNMISSLKSRFDRVKANFFTTPEGGVISPFKAIVGALVLTGLFLLMLPLLMVLFVFQLGLVLVGLVAALFMGSRKPNVRWENGEKVINPQVGS